jgi:hypothetical protein
MKSNPRKSPLEDQVIGCRGLLEQWVRHGPKALLFGILTILWIFPSLGSFFILAVGYSSWSGTATWLDTLRSIPFEHWLAFLVLVLHLAFALSAYYFYRKEIPPDRAN